MSDTRWQRLRRHGAFHAAVIFASAVWLGLQAADVFGAPMSFVRLLGFAFIVVFSGLAGYAWVDTRGVKVGSRKTAGTGRRRWQAVVVAALTLILMSGGMWWLRPLLFGAVRPGADVIAVLPFSTSGPSVGLLGEGLVDLLSTNLNEVGRIRTIDPRTTLHRWKQVAVNGTVDLDGALEVGRGVGAGSVLLGSVVEAGGTVRLAAELTSVDGGRLASASREGAADSVFDLVDRLSVDLLREVWRAREPLPELRLSAITTSSPDALRAYMQGEQHFRGAEWDSARIGFERAADEDSTFALAHFRAAEVYGWGEVRNSAAANRHAEAAERFMERLPAAERSLIVAKALQIRGDLSGIDTLRAHVARYPEDATGWYLLADAQLHAFMLLTSTTVDDLYQPFDRALELDPSFVPAALHPLELSVMLGDSARFNRYISQLDSVGLGSAAFWRAAGDVRWGPRTARLSVLAGALRNDAYAPDNRIRPLLHAHLAAVLDDSLPSFPDVQAGFDSAHAVLPSDSRLRRNIWINEALAAAGMGHFRAARGILDTLRAIDHELAFQTVLPVYLWGARPPDYGVPDVEWFTSLSRTESTPPSVWYWQAFLKLVAGDTVGARRILEDADQIADTAFVPVFNAMRSWARIARGDTVDGIDELEAHLRRAGYGSRRWNLVFNIRIQLALLQTAHAERRETALQMLRMLTAFEPTYSLLFAAQMAEAYERAGMTAEAARIWMRYVAVLEQGDPEVQPYVEAARRALERLAAERAP